MGRVRNTSDFNTQDLQGVYKALRKWDDDPFWPPNSQATIVLLGGAVLAFYKISLNGDHDATDDIDAIILSSTEVPDALMLSAERLAISFRAGSVAWLQQDWDSRIQWSTQQFEHLIVGWLDPYDWIISKLGRWLGHDPVDAIAVARTVDPQILYEYVKDALIDYIGDPVGPRGSWNNLVDAMGWPSSLKILGSG